MNGEAITAARVDRPARAILFVTAAVALLTFQDAVIKWLLERYPLMEIMFIRSLAMLPAIVAIAAATGQLRRLRTRRIGAHALRVVLNFLAFVTYFAALRLMPLADTLAIVFSAPVFIVVFGALLLREKVGPWRWTAVLIGFAGVLVMIRPGTGMFGWPAFLALLSSVFYALWMLTTRTMAAGESSIGMLFYAALSFAVVGAVAAPFQWVTPSGADLAVLLGVGMVTMAGLLLLIVGYRLAPASLLAPFDYTSMAWAVLLGYAVWGDVPGPWVIAGTVLVIAAGLIIVEREARLHRHAASVRGPVEEEGALIAPLEAEPAPRD